MDRKRPVTEQVRLCHQTMRELYRQYGSTDEALHRGAEEVGHDAAVDAENDLADEADRISAKMRGTRPKTFAGVAAIAYALKLNEAHGYWDAPEGDRDWEARCVTQFIDRLIELGMPSATALA
jgi:hypothetical protein